MTFMSRVKVKFSVVDEFLAELRKNAGQVQGRIVRLTRSHQDDDQSPPRWIAVVAGALVSGQLIELSVSCGQDWGKGVSETERTEKRARETMDRIKKVARTLGLDVRQGHYEIEDEK
ncbi:MAG: hypothetical protein HY369_00450 [Candidatus Aenigmarchaeota archaeon]|nr:hypothetical protein [Candidatus Aenigmarchaeota archaeon]